MRPFLVALAAALTLAACSGPCEDLGNRLCACVGAGTTRDTCQRQVANEIGRLNPSKSVEDVCTQKLDTCNAPADAEFCDWTQTECGKASCGLSVEDPSVCLPAAPVAP